MSSPPYLPSVPAVAPSSSPEAIAGGTELVAPALGSRVRQPMLPKQYLWIAGAIIVLYLALTRLSAVLTPFLVGAIASRGAGALGGAVEVLFYVGFVPLLGLLVMPWVMETKGKVLAD